MIENTFHLQLLNDLNVKVATFPIFVLQCTSFLISIFIYSLAIIKSSLSKYRPISFFVILFLLIYSLPSILYGHLLFSNFEQFKLFLFAVNFSPLLLSIFLLSTDSISNRAYRIVNAKEKFNLNKFFTFLVFLSFCIILIYLYFIPFTCTGIWALIFDPVSTSVARELTGKLNAHLNAHRIFSLFVNVLAPMISIILLYKIINYFVSKKFLKLFIFIILFIFFCFLVIIPGIKSALLFPFLATFIFTLASKKSNKIKTVISLFILLSFVLTISVFNFRFTQEGSKSIYNFGRCAFILDACSKGVQFLDSISSTTKVNLGTPKYWTDKYRTQIEESCLYSSDQRGDFSEINEIETIKPNEIETIKPNKFEAYNFKTVSSRIFYNAKGFLDRVFKRPLHVSLWHFIYVQDFGSPGPYSISIPFKWLGLGSQKLYDMPTLVYQNFGAKYENDYTLTGSAPTSFLLAYTAYFGLTGLFLSLALILFFDFIFSYTITNTPFLIKVSATTLAFIATFNMLSSDFFTVMISHGSLFALLIIALSKLNFFRGS